MNAITTTTGPSGLIPTNMDQAMRLADMMARGKMMPEHLRNLGDCLMVVEQAMRWNMSPFAVAQSTFSIKGKLLFAGTLVAAAIEHSGAIMGLMDYKFSGEGAARKVVVSATRRGEAEPRTVEVALKDAKTGNDIWNKQPDQQLVYHGARIWARRWTPGVMLGVYTPDEMPMMLAAAQEEGVIDGVAEPAAPEPPKRPSIKEWLDALSTDLDAAEDAEGVDTILARVDVQRAMDSFQNGARARLAEITTAARHRTAPLAETAVGGGPVDDEIPFAVEWR